MTMAPRVRHVVVLCTAVLLVVAVPVGAEDDPPSVWPPNSGQLGACAGEAFEDQTGLTNMGFETGDFTGWRADELLQGAAVIDRDPIPDPAFADQEPFHGEFMARLGTTAESAVFVANVMCQDFVVTSETERFAYNLFNFHADGDVWLEAWLWTPFITVDSLLLEATTGGAERFPLSLESTGWTEVEVDLSGHVGEPVRLEVRLVAGAIESPRAWVYLDGVEVEPVSPQAQIEALIASIEDADVHRENQLTNALRSALHHLDHDRTTDACDALERFTRHVQRQAGQGQGLSDEQAQTFLEAAGAVMDELGC
jgi:hypothetical protein